MKKQEFLDELKKALWALPEADQKNSLEYYAEMIDDRMEDGLSEEEAVAAIGDLDEIVDALTMAEQTALLEEQNRGL